MIPIRLAPRASRSVGGSRPLQARPLAGGPLAPRRVTGAVASSGFVLFIVSHMTWIAIAAIFVAHLLFAQEEHDLAVRALTAVPAMIFILEARTFLRDEAGELPFVVLALAQYYMVFGFGVFFDLKFFDLHGPVHFTPNARISGAVAVAVGAVFLAVGARLGRRFGSDLQPTLLRAVPPPEVPARWDDAFFIYAGSTIFVTFLTVFFPNVVPAAFALPALFAFSFDFSMGLALVLPPRRLGPRAAQLLIAIGVINGMARGQLDFVFRTGMAYVTGRWAAVRRVSFRVIAVIMLVYVVVQPVKHTFREQVWAPATRTGASIGAVERVDAWGSAFSIYFGDQPLARSEDGGDSAMGRLSELGSVMHAFEMLPGRVEYLEGAGFIPILYAPIPRFIWPDKPTTRDTIQRYGIVFGRQGEADAITTAVNLPLLVEGYWNFGWPGIVLVTLAMGAWMGFAQKLFSGTHWAMRAMGVANITNITVGSPVVLIYSAIFQTLVGRLAVAWAVYWLAKMLSGRVYKAPAGIARPRLAHG